MSYHNTNNEKGATLQESRKKAKSQDEMVLEFLRSHEQLGVTPERTLRHFKIMEPLSENRWHNTPITSIRRSFSNLKKKGLIYKTGQTIEGDFGKTDSNMESEVTQPSQKWAYETIEIIKEAITEREGRVGNQVINELSGIYADVLLVEINKLRSNIKRELYGDGNNNSVVELMNEIADIYNITVDQLELKTRKRQYLEPRQLFHWAMVNKVVKNSLTLEQIGQLTGGHDHATVLHSNRQVKDRIATEREFREMVMKFCNKFGLRTHWTGNNIETTRVI